eukprot:285027-Rhodomonas_salina.3
MALPGGGEGEREEWGPEQVVSPLSSYQLAVRCPVRSILSSYELARPPRPLCNVRYCPRLWSYAPATRTPVLSWAMVLPGHAYAGRTPADRAPTPYQIRSADLSAYAPPTRSLVLGWRVY